MNKIETPATDPASRRQGEVQESIYPNLHEVNVGDGLEFLDDGARMKDQPLEIRDDSDPIEEVYE